jgi:hypothetical protein
VEHGKCLWWVAFLTGLFCTIVNFTCESVARVTGFSWIWITLSTIQLVLAVVVGLVDDDHPDSWCEDKGEVGNAGEESDQDDGGERPGQNKTCKSRKLQELTSFEPP